MDHENKSGNVKQKENESRENDNQKHKMTDRRGEAE